MKKLMIALLVVPAVANAGFFSGNELLDKMNSKDYMDKAQALGYVQGVFDAGQRIFHCAPDGSGVNAGQAHDIVKNYLERNPANRNFAADTLINEAFRKVWPCSKKGGQ